MNERILAASSPGEVRVAVVQDRTLVDYAIWRPGAPDGVGDVYRGHVTAKLPAMAGCFVDLGGAQGFLPDGAGGVAASKGDLVTVRVTRAAQGGKGPRLAALAATERGPPTGLLARGPGPLVELARSHPEAEIWTDNSELVARLRLALGDRLRVMPVAFDAAIEEQVAALAEPSVALAKGARLSIHPTPALVAIDIDAGREIAARDARTAAHLATNRTILPELARQIRLRNLSGAILVDFAGLSRRRRASLADPLRAALAGDTLRPRLLGITALGLAEIVRPRVHPPLHELLVGPHAAGLAALRAIAAELAHRPGQPPALRAAPAVVAALAADAEALPDLAHRAGRSLILRADPRLSTTGWIIEKDGG